MRQDGSREKSVSRKATGLIEKKTCFYLVDLEYTGFFDVAITLLIRGNLRYFICGAACNFFRAGKIDTTRSTSRRISGWSDSGYR